MTKILIVEDDRKIAMALALRFKSKGYEVYTAYDAVQAVSTAVKLRPEVVVLDIGLPGGGGLLVADRVRALVQAPVQIIVMTASKKAGLEEQARALGAVAYFEKPFHSAEMLASIQDALDRAA